MKISYCDCDSYERLFRETAPDGVLFTDGELILNFTQHQLFLWRFLLSCLSRLLANRFDVQLIPVNLAIMLRLLLLVVV